MADTPIQLDTLTPQARASIRDDDRFLFVRPDDASTGETNEAAAFVITGATLKQWLISNAPLGTGAEEANNTAVAASRSAIAVRLDAEAAARAVLETSIAALSGGGGTSYVMLTDTAQDIAIGQHAARNYDVEGSDPATTELQISVATQAHTGVTSATDIRGTGWYPLGRRGASTGGGDAYDDAPLTARVTAVEGDIDDISSETVSTSGDGNDAVQFALTPTGALAGLATLAAGDQTIYTDATHYADAVVATTGEPPESGDYVPGTRKFHTATGRIQQTIHVPAAGTYSATGGDATATRDIGKAEVDGTPLRQRLAAIIAQIGSGVAALPQIITDFFTGANRKETSGDIIEAADHDDVTELVFPADGSPPTIYGNKNGNITVTAAPGGWRVDGLGGGFNKLIGMEMRSTSAGLAALVVGPDDGTSAAWPLLDVAADGGQYRVGTGIDSRHGTEAEVYQALSNAGGAVNSMAGDQLLFEIAPRPAGSAHQATIIPAVRRSSGTVEAENDDELTLTPSQDFHALLIRPHHVAVLKFANQPGLYTDHSALDALLTNHPTSNYTQTTALFNIVYGLATLSAGTTILRIATAVQFEYLEDCNGEEILGGIEVRDYFGAAPITDFNTAHDGHFAMSRAAAASLTNAPFGGSAAAPTIPSSGTSGYTAAQLKAIFTAAGSAPRVELLTTITAGSGTNKEQHLTIGEGIARLHRRQVSGTWGDWELTRFALHSELPADPGGGTATFTKETLTKSGSSTYNLKTGKTVADIFLLGITYGSSSDLSGGGSYGTSDGNTNKVFTSTGFVPLNGTNIHFGGAARGANNMAARIVSTAETLTALDIRGIDLSAGITTNIIQVQVMYS